MGQRETSIQIQDVTGWTRRIQAPQIQDVTPMQASIEEGTIGDPNMDASSQIPGVGQGLTGIQESPPRQPSIQELDARRVKAIDPTKPSIQMRQFPREQTRTQETTLGPMSIPNLLEPVSSSRESIQKDAIAPIQDSTEGQPRTSPRDLVTDQPVEFSQNPAAKLQDQIAQLIHHHVNELREPLLPEVAEVKELLQTKVAELRTALEVQSANYREWLVHDIKTLLQSEVEKIKKSCRDGV
jgi:hypothetical protein